MTRVLLAVSLLAACTGSGCAERAVARSENAEPASVPVATHTLTRADLTLPIAASGVLGADRQSDLAFKVGGVVERVLVDEGQRVAKGQLLATIDATEYRAAAAQARESLAKADRDVVRARTLHEQSSIPLASYENAETGVAVARSQSEAAEFNVRHTSLIASAAGVVDQRFVQAGEIVGMGQPIFRVSTSQGGRVVRVGLADRERLAVRHGDVAEVRIDAQPGRVYRGVVDDLATFSTPGTGSFAVEVRVDDRSLLDLPSGLTAKVTFTRHVPHALSVPLEALVDGRAKSAAVFVVENAHAKRVAIDILEFAGATAVVTDEALADGSLLVTRGASDLRDGQAVITATEE